MIPLSDHYVHVTEALQRFYDLGYREEVGLISGAMARVINLGIQGEAHSINLEAQLGTIRAELQSLVPLTQDERITTKLNAMIERIPPNSYENPNRPPT